MSAAWKLMANEGKGGGIEEQLLETFIFTRRLEFKAYFDGT
jgi:hypothetical protein